MSEDKEIPFLAVGADELGDELPSAIECPMCMGMHDIQNSEGTDQTGKKTIGTLQFYKCGDSTYLAGIKGKMIDKLRNK